MDKKTNISIESVEANKSTVKLPGLDDLQGVVKTTFSLPPLRPELRVSVRPFVKKNRSREPEIFILTSRKGAKLLSAVLKKTAEMIDDYADQLPDKEL